MLLEAVLEIEQPGVAQPHHRDRDEWLGDRAHPVLRVEVGPAHPDPAVERADGVTPDEAAVAHDAGRGRRQPGLPLDPFEAPVEVARGRRVDGPASASFVTQPP